MTTLVATLVAWFNLALITFIAFRFTRILAVDVWPPAAYIRRFLIRKVGESNPWSEIFTCSHCTGFWVSGVAVILALILSVPLPYLGTSTILHFLSPFGWWFAMAGGISWLAGSSDA